MVSAMKRFEVTFMIPHTGRRPRKTVLIITDTDLAVTKPLVKSLDIDAFSFAEAVQGNHACALTVLFIAFPYVRIYCGQTIDVFFATEDINNPIFVNTLLRTTVLFV